MRANSNGLNAGRLQCFVFPCDLLIWFENESYNVPCVLFHDLGNHEKRKPVTQSARGFWTQNAFKEIFLASAMPRQAVVTTTTRNL